MLLQPVSRSGPGLGGLLDQETGPVPKSNPVANPIFHGITVYILMFLLEIRKNIRI
jgi:hypothetical protein